MSVLRPRFIRYLERNPDFDILRTLDGWVVGNGNFEMILHTRGELITEMNFGWRGEDERKQLVHAYNPDMSVIYAAFALVGGEK